MRCVINQFRPLYLNSKTNDIRLGNHPETGTKIENAPFQVLGILSHFLIPADRKAVASTLSSTFGMPVDNVESLIQQLLDVGYLIDADAASRVLDNSRLMREALYFAMQGNYLRVPNMLSAIMHSHVTILGIGGIGSIIAETLARAGVGRLTIIDDDQVEESNLIRQTLFSYADIGRPKVEAATDALKRINPFITISALMTTVKTDGFLAETVHDSDIVVSTIDRPVRSAREMVNRLCVSTGTSFIFAGFSEHVGITGPLVVPGETACYQCILEQIGEVDDITMNADRKIPSYGPLCLSIGAITSDEVIRYVSGYAPCSLMGTSLMLDMATYTTTRQRWQRMDTCPVCSSREEKDATRNRR